MPSANRRPAKKSSALNNTLIGETQAKSDANTTASWNSVRMTLGFIGLTVLAVLGVAFLALTRGVTRPIARIVKTVSNIQDSSAAIAGAVEEQGAASSEIARNTQRAAAGTTDVTANISGVSTAAEMTGAASTQLMTLSSKLNEQSNVLQKEVGDFVHSLKAA